MNNDPIFMAKAELEALVAELRQAHGAAIIAQGEAVRRMEEAEQALRDNTSILHEEARIYYDRATAAEKRLELYATAARVIALHLERFCDESLPYDQMIADAARRAGAEISNLESQFQRAREWNELNKLERNTLRARLDEAEDDMSIQGVRMGEAQETIYALKNALRELCEKMEAGISGPEETERARALLS